MAEHEERMRDRYSTPSPDWLCSPSLISSTEWWRTERGEDRKNRRGRGSGSCGSHFTKAAVNRQRCSFGSACASEFTAGLFTWMMTSLQCNWISDLLFPPQSFVTWTVDSLQPLTPVFSSHPSLFPQYLLTVCVCMFTHPLGPGRCPCVKRQSLLGGFCYKEKVKYNMKHKYYSSSL